MGVSMEMHVKRKMFALKNAINVVSVVGVIVFVMLDLVVKAVKIKWMRSSVQPAVAATAFVKPVSVFVKVVIQVLIVQLQLIYIKHQIYLPRFKTLEKKKMGIVVSVVKVHLV